MRKALILLALAGLAAACLGGLSGSDARAGMPGVGTPPEASALYMPARVWRDCQVIALCSGCKPVYRCRSCSYQKTCQGGVCGWGDVCVWGPYIKVLPPGARIVRE